MDDERQYLTLLSAIRTAGERRSDRTGTGTLSLFGAQMRFDLAQGFPLLTTKRINFRAVVAELLWFIRGETNTNTLTDAAGKHVGIWDEWADKDGSLGPIYGEQWRAWPGPDGQLVDQLAWVVDEIKRNPYSRRLVVSAWNVCALPQMHLQPCHVVFQFYVRNTVHGPALDCQLYQRSGDMFLGVPFNIASYALLTRMVAYATGLKPGHFIHTLGDAHIYLNHLDQVDEQLSRDLRPLPGLQFDFDTPRDLFRMQASDITLVNYDPHPAIAAPVSV